MSRDKGLVSEILSSDTHFTTLENFEKNLETQRATNYEVYRDRQTKLNQEQAARPEELSIWTKQRDKAFFKHMIALKWHRSKVHHLRDFEQIASLSSSKLSTSLSSELENNSKITTEYLDSIEAFINDREEVSHSISKLETQKRSLESQAASMVLTTVSKLLFDPFSTGSKKELSDLHHQLTEIEHQLSNQRTEFQQKWQTVFDDYKSITQEELKELKKQHTIYQALNSDLLNMEAAIAEFPNQTLGEHYAEFKRDRSQYNLMHFCEKVITCGYDERLNTGQNPLADIIPTLKRLYPELSEDLKNLSTTLTTNLKNRDELLLLQQDMIQKNKQIEEEIETIKTSITELNYKIANLAPLARMSSFIGGGEKEGLTKQLTQEEKSLKHLNLAYHNREQLIVRLKHFLSDKSGNNLYILYRYAQQDRKLHTDRNTVARCLETSYPHAVQQVLLESQQKVAHIPTKFITDYLSDLKKIQHPNTVATSQERALAASLDKFITTRQSWDQLSALQSAINNYPQYRESAIFKPLIDSIMDFCVDDTPLSRQYVPKVVVMTPSIILSNSEEAPLHVEDIEAKPQINTAAEKPISLSIDYIAFMESLAKINSEKMKPKESQNLSPLYQQRYALFDRYMSAELDARGRQRALHHNIVRLNKDQAKPLDTHYRKLNDTHPLKLKLFEFLVQPTWYKLEGIQHAITEHPEYYQDETLDALLSEIMTILVQSVELTRSIAIHNHLGKPGHFTRRAIQEQNKALYHTIQAYNKEAYLSNDEQWKAIQTVGTMLLNALDLVITQPGSHDYVKLLAQITTFVTKLTAPAAERQVSEVDFHMIQASLTALTAPTNPIRIATEFMIATAQKTQEYKLKHVDATQQTLRAEIDRIVTNDPTSNAFKWKAVFDLIPVMRQYSDETEDKSERGIFENCMITVQNIINIIQNDSEKSMNLDLLFKQLNTLLELLHNQPFKDAVATSMRTLKKTNEYRVLANTNTDKWNAIFQLFLVLDDYSDKLQNKSEQATFKTCMPFIEHIITIVRDQPEDRALAETLLSQLDELLASVDNHPFKEGVQHIVAIIKKTDDYHTLMNPPSSNQP